MRSTLGQGQIPVTVPRPNPGCLTGNDQLRAGIRSHRLQQAVPRGAALLLRLHHGLVDQVRDDVQHVVLCELVAGTDGLSRLEAPAAHEDREAVEESPLLRRQQVIAPVHRRLEGLVPFYSGATAPRQLPETVLQSSKELLWG